VNLPDPSGWVAVALLGKTRGNRGEITAEALSSKPERYQLLKEVFLVREGPAPGRAGTTGPLGGERFEVESAWFHQGVLILKFKGVDTISDAELLSGAEVRIPLSERTPLEEGEYFQSDLVGCELVDRQTGEPLARVTGWEDGGGSGLLVTDAGWYVPFVRSICVEIDPASRRIVVELPEGLRDLNRQ
jgi:16S rRNA processing protein RimM